MIWRLIARLCALPRVADWLIRRAQRVPYWHIYKGDQLYMERYWLFNPYWLRGEKTLRSRFMALLPSVRIHHIVRPDDDRDLHDHPWAARTIILKGWYYEDRLLGLRPDRSPRLHSILRDAGETASLQFAEYHKITQISGETVWTLFITWKYQGTWGFLVDGKKVPYKTYLKLD